MTRSLLALLALFFLFGCASKKMDTLPGFEAQQFDTGMYTSKVDNFIVLLDASSSMYEKFNGERKFHIATAVVDRMNQTVPELGQTAGLRSFGHSSKVTNERTKLFYGMEKYNTAKLKAGLDQVTEPGGFSPLYLALDAAGTDLKGLSGIHNAVIIVSDGMDLPGDVLASAQNLKDMYGTSICFYTILTGNNPEGEKLLREIAQIGDCGFFTTADEVLTSAGMASFVEKVFLNKKAAAPAPKPVAAKPVKSDKDQDGVLDEDDKCPGTPIGADVNAEGCWVLGHVLFDFDKDVIKPEAYPLLDKVAAVLEKNPLVSVELHGHTDNVGTREYNMDLSMRRAHAVKNYLVGKGILKNRMATVGFGYTKPAALNLLDSGRAKNRRVELHPY